MYAFVNFQFYRYFADVMECCGSHRRSPYLIGYCLIVYRLILLIVFSCIYWSLVALCTFDVGTCL